MFVYKKNSTISDAATSYLNVDNNGELVFHFNGKDLLPVPIYNAISKAPDLSKTG